ncbi:MAG: hypothetical protein RLZZ117_725 [Cyanobacteriota bacterium]
MADSLLLHPLVSLQDGEVQVADQRFEMRMSKPLMQGLGIMADKEGLTRADVVRRALGLYALALQAEDKGQLIGFARVLAGSGPEVVELIKLRSTADASDPADPGTVGEGSSPVGSPQQSQPGYQRFEMRMSQQLLHGLDTMAEKEGIHRADVVRRALGLYALALRADAKGQCIAFAKLNKGNTVAVDHLIRLRP